MISDFDEFPYRLDAELGRLRHNQEIVEQKLSDAHRQRATVDARLANTEAELAAGKKLLRTAQEEARVLRDEQARWTKRLEAEQERVRAKTEEVFKLQAELAELNGQTDLANIEQMATAEEVAQLRRRVQEDAKRAEALRGKLQGEVERTRADCEARLDEQAKKFAEDAAERAELVTKLKKFEKDTNSIRIEFENELRNEKARSETALRDVKDDNRRLSEEIASVRHRNAALDEQLATTRRESQRADDALRDLRKQHSDMNNDFIDLRAEFDTRVSEELAMQADQINRERRDMKRAVDDATAREAAATERAERLDREVQELREKVRRAQLDTKDARARQDEAEQALRDEEQRHGESKSHSKKLHEMLSSEVTRSQARSKELEEELAASAKALAETRAERDKLSKENVEFRSFTVSRELELELRGKLAETEKERDEAVRKRDEVVVIIDSLKRDRAEARAKQEEAEVEADRALTALRELAALFDLPAASVMSLETSQKSLLPRVREAAAVAAAANERERRQQGTIDGLRQELDRLSEENHKLRCEAETERQAARAAARACEEAVAAADGKVRALTRQVENERDIARDDIDSLGRSHESALRQLRADRDRVAEEARVALLEVDAMRQAAAALAKDKEVLERAKDVVEADSATLKRDLETRKRELEAAKEEVVVAQRRAADLEDDKERLAKAQAQHSAQVSDIEAHYQREIESLKTALRHERSKFLREIDFTHAADARAYSAQRQLDVFKTTETDAPLLGSSSSSNRRQRLVTVAYADENRAPQYDVKMSSFSPSNNDNNSNVNSAIPIVQRGQGLSSHSAASAVVSPTASWNRTLIVSNPPAIKTQQLFQSPGADTPPPSATHYRNTNNQTHRSHHHHLGVSLSPEPIDQSSLNTSASERVAEEAQHWRETRIQHQPHGGRGGLQGTESSPNRTAVGRSAPPPPPPPLSSSRSVPLSAYRRK